MNIVFFLIDFSSMGTNRALLKIANSIADNEKDLKITILSGLYKGKLIDEVSKNIEIKTLDSYGIQKLSYKLAKFLKGHKPDTIFSSHDVANCIVYLATSSIGFSKRPKVIVRRPIVDRLSVYKSYKTKAIRILTRKAIKDADMVITTSQMMKKRIINITKISHNYICVIQPPFNLSDANKIDKQINHPWFLHNEYKIILGCGKLTPDKGFDILIKAFSKIKQNNTKLIILGEGSERQALENLIEKLGVEHNVDLLGFKNNPIKYMENSSVFVLPSRREGVPNVIFEAMSCGLPIVASDCPGGMQEILKNDTHSFISPVEDVDSLVEYLETAVQLNKHQDIKKRLQEFSSQHLNKYYLDILLN